MRQLHGSGKTAVLVERIINKIINEKIDINNILVVTFTNAAASEIRERVINAIYKKLEENPSNMHLQKQITLINKSNISTIHSFCLDVIKNNFFEIDISPNFRIGNQAEIDLLKQETLEDLFEEKYENEDKEFLKLIDTYTNYRGDENLKEILLDIYKVIQSNPFPEEWLQEKTEMFNISNDLTTDFSNTIWGKILLDSYKEELHYCILQFKNILPHLNKYPELKKYSDVINIDIQMLENLALNMQTWDKAYMISNSISFEKWPIDRKIDLQEKELAKQARDKIKKDFNKVKEKYLIYDSEQANKDIYEMYNVLNFLKSIIIEFSNRFSRNKLEKNIIDFNDIEHFALKILLKKEGNTYIPTEIAKKYRDKFEEIAIDEYQDSNLVQEYILTTISKNNMFMVGDVKQSIYKFRQARPELFLDKYEKYKEESNQQEGIKIKLFKNFRSRENILNITNSIFEKIMSRNLGDIEYNQDEYLNLGASYETPQDTSCDYAGKCEVHVIDKQENTEDDEETEERIEDTLLEAKFVAKRIKELIDSKYQVFDKKVGYRDITYKDIVILLRATASPAPIYEKEILNLNIPVYSDTSLEYLDSIEIQTIMAVLKIIDNPMQDIPLVAVLRSYIGKFTDDELVEIRLYDKNSSFYEALERSQIQVDENLKNKIINFLNLIKEFRKAQEYLSLDELIWKIYNDTGYFNFVSLMPNGSLRQANLKMLFERAKEYQNANFKGLFNFINFIDKIKLSSTDLGSAKLIGENENVVRLMSIHKSKGLEFPVVFLCGTGKKFNFMDLNQNILLHQDIGIGPKYINYERKLEYSTLAREAIKIKYKVETLSEEMRLLYVALTRSKEKLIITGLSKNIYEDLSKKESLLELYDNSNDKLNPALLKKYSTYLDWIELVYLSNKKTLNEILEFNVYQKNDLIKEFNNKIENTFDFKKELDEKLNSIEKIDYSKLLNWKYQYNLLSNIPTKTSVTELKRIENNITEIQKITNIVPKFLNEQIKLTNAQIGTATHLCIQKLDFKKEYTLEEVKELINNMLLNNILTKQEADSIKIETIYKFTKSNLYKQIQQGKQIYKEQPFYINIPIKEIYKEETEENILVQGIIDLYYINANDDIVLIDFKTDYVTQNDEPILVEKYRKQLEIYKKALEQSLNKKVNEVYIYSLYLNKEIKVN